MNKEHKAIIQAAKRDGLLPSEVASNLLGHDLLEACLMQLRKFETPFRKLSEKDQDAAIASMTNDLQPAIKNALRILNGAGVEHVPFTLKGMKIDSKLTVTGTVDGEDPNRHILTDKAHDKSEILLVLYPRDYFAAMDHIEGEKDQKDLNLEDGEAAPKKPRQPKAKAGDEPKPIDIPQKLFADALEFINRNQVCTVASLQNGLHIGFEKGQALLAKLEAEGIITAADESGNRRIIKITDKPTEVEIEEIQAMYDKAREFIVKHQTVSVSALATLLDADEPKVDEIISRLESDGVISAPDEDGSREVFEQ